MIRLLISWGILAFAIWATARFMPGIKVSGAGGALWVALIFATLSFLFGWLLFVFIGIGTLGLGFLFGFLTHWVVNAVLLRFTDTLTSKFQVSSWSTAFIAALIISLITFAGHYVWRQAAA